MGSVWLIKWEMGGKWTYEYVYACLQIDLLSDYVEEQRIGNLIGWSIN